MISNIAKEEQRKYFREWRKKNKAKIREYNEKFWEKQAVKNKPKEG